MKIIWRACSVLKTWSELYGESRQAAGFSEDVSGGQ